MAVTISSAVLTHSYITVTFSEAAYSNNDTTGALLTTDFALTYNDNADGGSSACAISSVTTITNTCVGIGWCSNCIY